MIRLVCPTCGVSGYSGRELTAGQTVRCPGCRLAYRLEPHLVELMPDPPTKPPPLPAPPPKPAPLPEPEPDPTATRRCPWCAEVILLAAKKCRHCGEYLDPVMRAAELRRAATARGSSPAVAVLLSFFLPGLGQIYRDRTAIGVAWFFAVAIGYAAALGLGLVLHVICIIHAGTMEDAR